MGKVVIAALVGSITALLGIALFSGYSSRDQGPQGEAWPAVLHAELEMAAPLEQDGLSTLVALAEELYWLRRAETAHDIELGSLLRQAGHIAKAADDDEGKALGFLIERVTASLGLELDRWQGQMDRIYALGGVQRDAALRILAFAKWQQKGGAYEYAYDFFQQLSNNSAPVDKPPPPTAVATIAPTLTPRPTRRPPPPRPRVREVPEEQMSGGANN